MNATKPTREHTKGVPNPQDKAKETTTQTQTKLNINENVPTRGGGELGGSAAASLSSWGKMPRAWSSPLECRWRNCCATAVPARTCSKCCARASVGAAPKQGNNHVNATPNTARDNPRA